MLTDPVPDGGTFEQSDEIGKLAGALVKAQKSMGNAKKESANPFFKSKYADLAAILETCKEPLADHDIARFQLAVSGPGGVPGIRTMLVHGASGQWVAATIYCQPKDTGPQGMGSVLSYLRRYSLAAAIGIATEDDDAEAAQTGEKGRPKPKAQTQPQPDQVGQDFDRAAKEHSELQQAKRLIGQDLKWDVKQSQAWLFDLWGVQKLADLNPTQLHDALVLLREKAAKHGEESYATALEAMRAEGRVLPLAKAS